MTLGNQQVSSPGFSRECGGEQRQTKQDKWDGARPGEGLETQARKSVVHCEYVRSPLKFSKQWE